MNGQWIGDYKGSNSGQIVVNVDELSDSYRGIASLKDQSPDLPTTAVIFQIKKVSTFQFRTDVSLVNPITGMFDTWENIKNQFPAETRVPKTADIKGMWNSASLRLEWETDIGTYGNCIISKSKASTPSELAPKRMSWNKFKDYVSKLEGKNYLFRGQRKAWRLRTSFHRHGRADLYRFLLEDIRLLHKTLSARTRHFFNLLNPDENGSFVNLVQHYGYPTPLLDWTFSPYVAAFFAYRGISHQQSEKAKRNEYVRIHVFDHGQWISDVPQFTQLLTPNLHFSITEFIAIDNERAIPQQAASSITNVDDIESYIKSIESLGRKNYLLAIDLPVRERTKVVEELQFMGITAGSLFPGLDGACEELKERRFVW